MDVGFEWNVKDQLVEKTFKLMGEFKQGEQYVIIRECLRAQRELEFGLSLCESFKCTLLYEEFGFSEDAIDFVRTLLCSKQIIDTQIQSYHCGLGVA